MLALHRRFPALTALPYLPLGQFPTPVTRLELPSGVPFFAKRDDLTSTLYGGNKVRKLGFVFGALRRDGLRRLGTVGAIGSHHCLATALHGDAHGFEVDIRHIPQPPTAHVRDNLLALSSTPARLALSPGPVSVALRLAIDAAVKTGWRFVAAGGSNPVGTLGYIDAACELLDQIDAGELPTPGRIFVPVGSGGTLAGLLAGFRLAGRDIPICGVRVVPGPWVSERSVARLANRALRLIRRADSSVSCRPLHAGDVTLDDRQLGPGYGFATPAAVEAARYMRALSLPSDLTYTAKTFAAVLARDGAGPALFWETLNGASLASHIARGGADRLPRAYHRYLRETE